MALNSTLCHFFSADILCLEKEGTLYWKTEWAD